MFNLKKVIWEYEKVLAKCAPVAETGNRCRSRDAGNRRSNQSRRSLPESTVRHRASRPVCADATADVQHPKSGLQKYKKVRFASGYESVGQNAGAPCGKEGIIV